MISDMLSPQDQAAFYFMERKGLLEAAKKGPRDVTKLDGLSCWYYVYDLDNAVLEIEVEWTGAEWSTMVTTYADAAS